MAQAKAPKHAISVCDVSRAELHLPRCNSQGQQDNLLITSHALLQASSSLPCVHENQMTEQAKFRRILLTKHGKLIHSCSKRQGATLRWLQAMARCAPWSFSSAWLPIYCTACPKCWLTSRTITYTRGCVPFWLKKLGPQCSTSSCTLQHHSVKCDLLSSQVRSA